MTEKDSKPSTASGKGTGGTGLGRASYRAQQVPGSVVIFAEGWHPTSGYVDFFEHSPLDVYPPQFILRSIPPTGPATQVLTPFVIWVMFSAKDPIKSVTVHDADGSHEVKVEQTPDVAVSRSEQTWVYGSVAPTGTHAAMARATTMATGEEGGGGPTTMATGEEEIGFAAADRAFARATTMATGEEGGGGPTTMATGEEEIGFAGLGRAFARATTMATGEESGGDPTTMATGEENITAPTTMATGEEGGTGPTTMATGEEVASLLTTLAVGEEGGPGGFQEAIPSVVFELNHGLNGPV